MYYALYDTEQAAKDDERKAFHAALHAVAAEHGWSHVYNSITQSPQPIEEITLQYLTDNLDHVGFLSRTEGVLRYDVAPLFIAVHPVLCTEGSYAGKWSLTISELFINRGFNKILSPVDTATDRNDLFAEVADD